MQTQNQNPFLQYLSQIESFEVQEVSGGSWTGENAQGRFFLVRVPTEFSTLGTDPTPMLENAKILLEEKDYLLAKNLFLYLQKQDPKCEPALEGLGICAFHLGERSLAKKTFSDLLLQDPTSPSYLYWLGRIYTQESSFNQAIKTLEKALEYAKGELVAKIWQEIGNCYAKTSQNTLAREAYSRAKELGPHLEEVYCNLGTLSLEEQDLSAAESHFKTALRLNPKSSRANSGLGLIALAQNKTEEAKTMFSTALNQDCQNTLALLKLYDLQKEGPLEEIKQRLSKFLLREPNHIEARVALTDVLLKEKNWVAFQNEIDSLIEQAPQHPKLQSLLKQTNRKGGEGWLL